jgi:hypothetical protein
LHQALERGELDAALAIDDGAGVLFAGTEIDRVVSWRSNATAYRVEHSAGCGISELPLTCAALA